MTVYHKAVSKTDEKAKFSQAKTNTEGGIAVTDQEIKETLEKQLQLLSERSKDVATENDLILLTHAMCEITRALFGL